MLYFFAHYFARLIVFPNLSPQGPRHDDNQNQIGQSV